MKHRIFLSLALLFAVLATASADDVQYLVIHYKTAQEPLIIALADDPVLTFKDGDMVVNVTDKQTKEKTTYTIPMAEINDAPLATQETITGIHGIPQSKVARVVAGQVLLNGVKPGAAATVYTIGGAVAKSAKADATGTLTIDLNSLPSGTYVVKTPVGTFKFRR